MNDSERDMTLARIDANVEALVKSRGDHEDRLRTLESAHHRQRGVVTTITAVVSAAWALVLTIVGVLWSR